MFEVKKRATVLMKMQQYLNKATTVIQNKTNN